MLATLGLFLILAITEKPPKPEPSNIPTYGSYAVVMTWQGMADIDLHVQGPDGQDAYFASQDIPGANLEHDDIPGVDGVAHPNHERTVIRDVNTGEYIVNTHFYEGGRPTKVTVTLYDIRDLHQAHKVATATYSLARQGAEHTAFRFRLDTHGNVRGTNHLQTRFVQ